jgi:hypothetical protein
MAEQNRRCPRGIGALTIAATAGGVADAVDAHLRLIS